MAAWIATTVILMLLPVDFPIRFAFGIQPMLAMPATAGVLALHERSRDSGWRSTLLALLVVAVLTTPMAYSRILIVSATGDALGALPCSEGFGSG